MFQDSHSSPSADNWQPLLDRFFERTLKGVRNGIEREPAVITEGRTASEPSIGFRSESKWPPAGTRMTRMRLPRNESYSDSGTVTEERSKEDPEAESEWLWHASAPLARNTRMAGEAILRIQLELNRDHGDLTPVLVDVPPDGGELKTVSRGFLNLRYRRGLAREVPVPVGEAFGAKVTFKPQDHTFEKGHRIGLLLQSSNTVWALPDEPGAEVKVLEAGLDLPFVLPRERKSKSRGKR
jgi:predicted acyl esterase